VLLHGPEHPFHRFPGAGDRVVGTGDVQDVRLDARPARRPFARQ